ncbi:amino acid permease [Paludibacterium paludis]|uniref:Tyrosine transporter TyrP n=1 Tax=Paludibacterium paludis TaxID=1225769 RepID=A0A918P0C2_9NEIS|nr:aromatic amino acid transport family protein [Paludibacterium paludis]GGY11574.1 tyrosine transporter TyrP [Paludibacterium paludis]
MGFNVKAAGATLLISGTMLGAGMLALPLVSAGMGYNNALFALLGMWVFMTYTGLMLLEVTLAFPDGSGFDIIALKLLGKRGQWITNFSLLLLLYALSSAYIAGASSTYGANLKHYLGVGLPPVMVSALFTLLIATIVFLSTRAVDRVNSILFSVNIIVFLLIAVTIRPYVNPVYLNTVNDSTRYMYAAFPVFLTAFGFHGSVPSMVKYIGRDKPQTLRNVFIAGGLIPMLVYAIWEYCSLGLLPRVGANSFLALSQQHGSVGMFLDYVHANTPNQLVPTLFSSFTSIALFTSYLCVSLGLFDSVASSLGQGDSRSGRLKTAVATYLPPFVFAWLYPEGFVMALGAAAIFLAVLAILFPAFALRKLRAKADYQPVWRVPGGTVAITLVSILGSLMIVFQILKMQNLLPMF